MSDFSGEHGFIPEWMGPALLLFGVGPVALAGVMGWPWWVGLAVLVAAVGVALLGWRVWGWLRGWRADRVLRREGETRLVLVPVADKAGNDHYDKGAGQ